MSGIFGIPRFGFLKLKPFFCDFVGGLIRDIISSINKNTAGDASNAFRLFVLNCAGLKGLDFLDG